MFKDLVTLIQLLAVIPATLATAERSFSGRRRVKAWLRSTMPQSQIRLNSAIMGHAYRDVGLQPDIYIETVVQEFVNLNDVRHRIFGKELTEVS